MSCEDLAEKLSIRLAEKWEKPYSEVCGFVNAHMSIAIVRATHLCLRGLYSDEQNVQPPSAVGEQSRPQSASSSDASAPLNQHCPHSPAT